MFRFKNGRPPRPRRLVETTPRIAQPLARASLTASPAREAREVVVVLNGIEHRLEVVTQPRIHGWQSYWCCSSCGSLRRHLYVLNGQIACRQCLNLSYRVKHTRNTAALRARKIRRKLGAPLDPMSPLPPRPRNVWAAAYYDRLVRELAVCEAAIAAQLRAMVRA